MLITKKLFFALACMCALNAANGQEQKATIPFELFGEHIFIQLSVNDSRPLDFIFDTGDGLTVLDLGTARELGILADTKVTKTSAGGSVTGALLKHQNATIGGLPISDIEIYETSLSHLQISIGREIDGIIGFDVLNNYALKVDYKTNQFILYDKNDFVYQGDGKSFPLKLTSYIPHIPASFTMADGTVLKGDFFIDTGARTAVDLNTPFVNKQKLVSKLGNSYSYLVSGLSNTETEHFKGRVKDFRFNGFSFQDLPIGLSQAEHGVQNHKKIEGILGNELLKHFNITYDYSGGKIYFEQNDVFDHKFMVDAAGIDFQFDEKMEKILIHQVHENSPAAEMGVEVDSELLTVNGKDATEYSLPELREIFSNDGGKATITVMQSGEEKSLDFDLKNLI